ncbi:hypothetical protein [uncultured Photobacterium sp.]|uniref:primase 1D-like protein n=1 Tax=uncultured Photobacterium sp. TaxID=173973 RepID=UPI00262E9DAA|nr:hypothetical protein [uncultured Photobacterium sp.]
MNNLSYLNFICKKNPNINILRVFDFSFSNKFQEINEELTVDEFEAVKNCIKYKNKYDMSFWESLFILMKEGQTVSKRMLNHSIFHNENNKYINIKRDDFFDYIKTDIDGNVALNSKVVLKDGTVMHIPMLDFKIPSNKSNLDIVHNVIEMFNLDGLILNSGKSFHFIGFDLITENDLINLLSKFILLHPISDKAWAAHQIIERSASLRISKKYGKYPYLMESKINLS